ncbi:GIY-YIG nuclease family protein [Lysobacter niastensis]|uniref:GIY-YIG nuclease family protein n=1 Tax=Lysobacter niastensis TaxID=380629 RepID=A0ABS0B6G0_9GAMM|nr:GIY-YIG nuclease family protein [Lysobacter niastensis]MBF6024458.1 GIY-YIG nuclease family protein [Lysobacter niastensis]
MGKPLIRSSDRRGGASEGQCFLYTLPCRDEDLVKVGFSRDPLARMESLHARYYDFFDLDRGFVVEIDTVSEARRFELRLKSALAQHNAPQPLSIHDPAGGSTEWYRGAYGRLMEEAEMLESDGFTVHHPLRDWIGPRLAMRSDRLYGWGEVVLTAVEGEPSDLDLPESKSLRAKVLSTLDAYSALDIPLAPLLPDAVMAWYRREWSATHIDPLPGEADDAIGQSH